MRLLSLEGMHVGMFETLPMHSPSSLFKLTKTFPKSMRSNDPQGVDVVNIRGSSAKTKLPSRVSSRLRSFRFCIQDDFRQCCVPLRAHVAAIHKQMEVTISPKVDINNSKIYKPTIYWLPRTCLPTTCENQIWYSDHYLTGISSFRNLS